MCLKLLSFSISFLGFYIIIHALGWLHDLPHNGRYLVYAIMLTPCCTLNIITLGSFDPQEITHETECSNT